MPYAPSESQTQIEVTQPAQYDLTMYVLPDPPWSLGQEIDIYVELKANGQPVEGAVINLKAQVGSSPLMTIASGLTNAFGQFHVKMVIPLDINGYQVPCNLLSFLAEAPDYNVNYSLGGYVQFETTITVSAPSQVEVNQEFEVTGSLYYIDKYGNLVPLSFKTIEIYVDNQLVGYTATDEAGNYFATIAIDTAGTHTITARFAGEGGPYAAAQASTSLNIGIESKEIVRYTLPGVISAVALLYGVMGR